MAHMAISLAVLIETIADSTRIEIAGREIVDNTPVTNEHERVTIYEGYATEDAVTTVRDYSSDGNWWWFNSAVNYIEVLSDGTLYIEVS